ncbi:hypothetical protein VDG1235_3395 [Verrucomicrobiia bacterium DG1235]|nr:hypothetical protein VDG1235_3395 [Verrucomicrobiae bacterium DG1235]
MKSLGAGIAVLASLLSVVPAWAGDDEMMEGEERAFLGVYVEAVSSVVSSQLGLDEGVGVVVEGIVDDSPAKKAELKKNDILLKFDDQILIGTKQIVVLVRRSEIGSEHELTLLRGGKEQVVKVTIEGKIVTKKKKHEEHGQFFDMPMAPGAPMAPRPHISAMNALTDSEDFETNVMIWKSDDEVDFTRRMEMNEEMETLMQRVNSFRGQSDAVPMPTFIFQGEDHVFEFSDGSGQNYTIIDKNGERTLRIVDESGKEIYAGSLDEAALKNLPDSVKDKLPKIQKIVKVRPDSMTWSSRSDEEVF